MTPNTPSVDIETVKQLMQMMMAFFSPSKAIDPTSSKEDVLMNADIGRMKDDLKEIKDTLKDMNKTHVTVGEHNSRIISEDKILNDHEIRIRSTESSVVRIMTWGSTALVLLTAAQIVIKLFGK